MVAHADLIKVLDWLESREYELIGWGDTGGFFSIAELEAAIEQLLPEIDPEEMEDELREQAMILPVLDGRDIEIGVRSRAGEAMHLYRNLRQWFIGQDLRRASTLVSDYRFIREPRTYPKRNVRLDSLLEQLSDGKVLKGAVKTALAHIAGDFELAGFQQRATDSIISAWALHNAKYAAPTATIICAGTGSGKTLAFYLPALASLASDLIEDSSHRVRILAIYPRIELLKDQFNETWTQSRLLDDQLVTSGARKIRIGALFGDTPSSARYTLKGNEEFYHFRLLQCETEGCQGEMRWSKADITRDRERLICSSCGHSVSGEQLALTRFSARRLPPDILFTTTEMLNQRMTDSGLRSLFGIGVSHNLPLVLLDEVHTYSGTSGAQTALLLRRWMRLSGKRPHFVGLSATLRDAPNFFSLLTGTLRSRVNLVEPKAEEMEQEGAEYLLALRGDPVSRTALLSTTIQTAMLTRRILDRKAQSKSKGVWGSKTFVFTDDLDVNNRLYSTLADAEGWWQRGGQLVQNRIGPLAQLRNVATTTSSTRRLRNFGQDWSIAKAVGFSLDENDRARVARTSSQDTGYDHSSEIVVTTASLEVGFNDPDVGAVIQHKAPRGVAAYLQRRGRAGRSRRMRPWMVIVLSDFGRDRVAYQQYENLIDPEVKNQNLPVDNIHILKMHAAQAVLDWISLKFSDCRIWYWLNRPDKNQQQLGQMLGHIDSVMTSGPAQDELMNYVGNALQINGPMLNRVLWQAPRSVFLEFLPTLRRRIMCNWSAWSDIERDAVAWAELPPGVWHSPVPEFIPDNSFSDLNAPDLQIRLQRQGSDQWNGMPFFQGLKEFAPGRFSKRYAVSTGAISDWLVPADYQPVPGDQTIEFEIDEAFGSFANFVGCIDLAEGDSQLEIYQPNRVMTCSRFADAKISDTSNAFLRWKTSVAAPNGGQHNSVPVSSPWAPILKGVSFYTHSALSPMEVLRYNTGSDATIKFKDGQSAKVAFDWTRNHRPAAIGVRQFVDSAFFEFQIPAEQILDARKKNDLVFALRAQYFQDLLRACPVFENRFVADWIYECFLAAIAAEQCTKNCDIESAVGAVFECRSVVLLRDVPRFLFQLDPQGESSTHHLPGEEPDEDYATKEQKLQRELSSLLESPDVLAVVRQLSDCLWQAWVGDADVKDWIGTVLANTLAASLHQTMCTLLPNVDERSVMADSKVDCSDGVTVSVWLNESESGGMGVIYQLQELYAEDPTRVLGILTRNLQPGIYEQLDADLFAALREAGKSTEFASALRQVRDATDYGARFVANRQLRKSMSDQGINVSHSFSSVLHSRVLRDGSNAETDRRLMGYLEQWHTLEHECGFELPLNVVAFVVALSQTQQPPDARVVFEDACRVQSLLWVRGSQVRHAALSSYNPFHSGNTRTERILGGAIYEDDCDIVEYDHADWLAEVHRHLASLGRVDLSLTREQSKGITDVMATLHVEPLDTHGLLLYPRVSSVVRRGDEIRLRVELAETIR